jgi:hypothetical protein
MREGDAALPTTEETTTPLPVIRLTPSEWRTVLERRSFLERDDNRFQTPRMFCGRRVEIVPDPSFR